MLIWKLKNADRQMKNIRTYNFCCSDPYFCNLLQNNFFKYSVKTFQFNSMFSLRKILCVE